MKIRKFNENRTAEDYLMTVEELRDIFLILIDELDDELCLDELALYDEKSLISDKTTGNKDILDKKFESVIVCITYNDLFKDIEPGYKISLDAYRRFNKIIDPIIDYIEKELIEKDYTISIGEIFGDDYIITLEVEYLYL